MLVKYLDGMEYNWNIKGKEVVQDRRPRSNLHILARSIIKNRFPTLQVLEEVPFKIARSKTLYLDFFLPLRKIAVEVHGQQHFKMNSLYHSSASEFIQQRKNDQYKQEWCDLNNIQLIVFRYDNQEDWESLL